MKVAFLIDTDAGGGGREYIRRKIAALPAEDEGRVFYSEKGECTASNLRSWGAERIVINHLRAAVQLFGAVRLHRLPEFREITFIVHGIHLRKYDWLPKSVVNRLRRCLRRRLESRIYHRCTSIVALTEADASEVRRLYGDDLNVVVEPNTLAGWTPPPTDVQYNGERFCYICIGRFDFPKGQDRWIRRMTSVEGRTLFIGDGPDLDGCRRLAAELGVDSRCVFAGAMPEADRYLKCAEAVVSPSRWEGMPYLLMKARVLGCRILATDCPGNREVLAGYEKWEKLEL